MRTGLRLSCSRAFAFGLIVFVAAGCQSGTKAPPEGSGQNESSVVVIMNSQGFDPQVLTIRKGATVVFKNSDTQDRWPASDFHPTHGIYPEFDPQANVAAGSSWSFTFTQTGTWRYHDHLVPSFTGIVKVTE